ncbi:MAG: MFS transporter [Hyphomicrobiaceae bacterium]
MAGNDKRKDKASTWSGGDKPPLVRIWRYRNYAWFEGGWLPNSITSWMQRVGVTWLAWELSHSNAWVGAVAAADLAPMLILAPIAGAMIDRSENPIGHLKLALLLLLLQAVALAGLAVAGLLTIEGLFVLSLVTGFLNPYTSAARQIVLANCVPRSEYPTAIALDSALYQGSRFVGPAIAAMMIGVWGVTSTFVAHVFGSIALLVAVYFIAFPAPERRNRLSTSLAIDIIDSIGYARRHGAIWPLFFLLAVSSVLLRPIQDLLPGFASRVFEAGPQGLGWLASAMGVGAMISATTIAMRARLQGLTTWAIVGTLILVAGTIGFTATANLSVGLLFAALTAFGLNTLSTSTQTITQSVVSDGMRGRVMSLYAMIFRGLPAIGALVLGLIADAVGLRLTFALAAVVTCAVWASVALRRRQIADALRDPGG